MTDPVAPPSPGRRRSTRRNHPRTVALTGVHGVAGAALLRRLDEDERVSRLLLIDRYAPALPLRRGTACLVDLTVPLADGIVAEALARERVETVIHTAFHSRPTRSLEAAHELEVIGTRALLRAVAHNVRHSGTVTSVVVLGTTMSYGAHADNPQYLSEGAPLRGGAGYPFVAEKVAAENEVSSFRRRTGLPTAMLRAAPTVGTSRTLLAQLLAPMLVPAVLGTDPLTQLLHVEDLVDAVRVAAERRADGVFNVAAEDVLPWSTVIKLTARLRVPAVDAALRAALRALWVAGVGIVPAAHVAFLRDTFVADTARAAEVLGFRARHDIREALARHVAVRRGTVPHAA